MRCSGNQLAYLTLFTGMLIIAPSSGVAASNECANWVAKIVSAEGAVETRVHMEAAWQPVTPNQVFCPGNMLRTQAHSRAALLLNNQTVLRLSQKSTLTFPAPQADKPFWLELLNGAVNVITRTPKRFQVDAPFVNAFVDGTEFLVTTTENETTISVFEGQVSATNPQGHLVLKSGESASASPGQAPVSRILVRPRDAVQWALYYPPVLSYRGEDFREGDETAWQGRVRQSIAAYQAGKLSDALEIVAQTPQGAQNAPSFFAYRAALLLDAGRSDEASADLQIALGLDPNNGPALAQQAVIAITQNRHGEALELAKRAVAQSPQAAASWIALSYAEQAGFNLPAALEAAQQAVEKEPGNALAWARLAELRLSLADLNGALAAANKAATLNPDLARTQTVLGYAQLVQINTRDARQSFERAITLDSSDPLPRLGLGLAKIRDGELAAGREEIEIATGLDPNNALVRSYMGKAYYEEKRSTLAATQFDIAKALDPNDPTPWFYDAILKQSTNRPVEALQDIQRSTELNDNRAVYRSRLLLDDDAAARGISLARIYRELGFEQLALREGAKSLSANPGNYAAHRLLADAHANKPGYEIARVSELLQAQMLQPLNITPVQPSLAEKDLLILGSAGPSLTGFNEFNPLFMRNQTAAQLTVMGGANNTLGNEITVSGLARKFSFSLGQFNYKTDGFRINNDITQNIYNGFFQFEFSPKLSAQIELRSKNRDNGDLALRVGKDNFSPNRREDLQEDSGRVGLRFSSSPRSYTLLSAIWHDSGMQFKDKFVLSSTRYVESQTKADNKGYDIELQQIWTGETTKWVFGGMYQNTDRKTVTESLPFGILGARARTSIAYASPEQSGAYGYATWQPQNGRWSWTAGASYNDLNGPSVNRSQLNHKFGVVWLPQPSTTLRAAIFRGAKRPLVSNQTLEPTQIAGFTQFFDDFDGTDTRGQGLGIDHRLTSNLDLGIEGTHRKLGVPLTGIGGAALPREEDRNERRYRGYIYWTLSLRSSLAAEYQWEHQERDFPPGFADSTNPAQTKTRVLPLSFHYAHPSGFFAASRIHWVKQSVNLVTLSGIDKYENRFWLTDLNVGYRLPHRRGMIFLNIANLFDKSFQYQDTNFQTGQARAPQYYPERAVFMKFNLAF